MFNLLTGARLVKVADHTAAGTSDVTSASVDLAGYEAVVFFTSLGTAAANNLMHAEQSSDDGVLDSFGDLTDTETPLAGASDEDLALEVRNVEKRYARVVVQRGTSSTCESVWALLLQPRRMPVDNTRAGELASSTVLSPIEGTP